MQLQEGRRGLTLGLSLISGQGSHEAGEALIHGIQTDVVVPVTAPRLHPCVSGLSVSSIGHTASWLPATWWIVDQHCHPDA